MNPEGIFLKRVKCGGMPYSLFPLSDNRWLVSCGDGHNWVELDWTNGKILRIMDDKLLGYKIILRQKLVVARVGICSFQIGMDIPKISRNSC